RPTLSGMEDLATHLDIAGRRDTTTHTTDIEERDVNVVATACLARGGSRSGLPGARPLVLPLAFAAAIMLVHFAVLPRRVEMSTASPAQQLSRVLPAGSAGAVIVPVRAVTD